MITDPRPPKGIVKLNRIGMTAPKHARFTTGFESIILGVARPLT